MPKGLTERQAQSLLTKHGENVLAEKKKRSPAGLFFGQFKDVLIIILAFATLFSVVIGQLTEAVTIIAIMLLNATMGFVQEYRTERTIQSLKDMTAPVARVWRGGELKRLPASRLVPGDTVELKAGDRIPADAKLISFAAFRSDESILSGESAPVEKTRAGDRVYMGASVTSGHGSAEVTATVMDTEMGRIASLLHEVEEQPTPLQKKLASLGRFVAVSCVLCGAAVVAAGVLRGENIMDMILIGVSLAVAAIPEGLPAIVTIVLALSVNRILARKAVIRKLHAVETLGSATVICADKTGTITENKMSVTAIYCSERRFQLTGAADSATGSLRENGSAVKPLPVLVKALETAALCSTASAEQSGDKLTLDGSPTETALLAAAHKCGVKRAELLKSASIVHENPFDSARKLMSVSVKRGGARELLVKGAPDVLLKRCDRICDKNGVRRLTESDGRRIVSEFERMAADAGRVVAAAYRDDGDSEEKLIFLALFCLEDPPRKEVREAVRRCKRAGIRPIMITGDHALTARAIAARVGIIEPGGRVAEGAKLDGMSEEKLMETASSVSVFARVTPEHKLRIVRALRKLGNVVAMTGDGVNDAPAIKEADIGVSMGISGSDVTKEASSVVILDDNFATIVAAVEEGRIIYQNIRRFIRFLLTSNLGEVLTVTLAMALGMPTVFIPIQILLINLVTDGLPAVALGMEPAGDGIMEKPPRDPGESLFAGGLVWTVLFRGAVLGLSNLLCFSLVLRSTGDITTARSAAYLTLVFAQMIHVFECRRPQGERRGASSPFANKTLVFACLASITVTLAVVYLPVLQSIFFTAPVTGRALAIAAACTIISPVFGIISDILRKSR